MPPSLALPAYWLFAVVAVVLLIIDLRQRRLPHVLTSVLWFASVAGFAAESLASGESRRFIEAVIAGVVVTMLALVMAIGFPGQLGLGDVSLAGAVAMSLGWLGLPTAARGLATALIVQAFVGIFAIWRAGNRQIAVPFGPALLIGWLLAIGLNVR
ncbi:prepilin peptidase [Actinoplanes sp. NPDC020271]|uniref:prepilin peptidase n=1 Tax=Actinoplanes sp. NPDC020271 TaxID=3363896 RepID=UPI00379CA17C